MPRSPSTYTLPPGTTPQVPNSIISSATWNAALDDIAAVLNVPWPVAIGVGAAGATGSWDAINAIGTDVASSGTINLTTATGPNLTITGTTTISTVTLGSGNVRFARANAAFQLTASANLIVNGSASTNYTTTAGDLLIFIGASGSITRVWVVGSGGVTFATDAQAQALSSAVLSINPANLAAVLKTAPPVRQTVLSGPITTAGLPNFGGSTGSGTVTVTGTLTATAANGFAAYGGVNRTGSAVNPSWTGLTTNGTMYLYADIAADGTWTTGSTTQQPVYQWGGTPSITSGLFTFNIQEMVGYVGNGATAPQTYRVFVGEVTVAGSVVTVITWYALMGRYSSAVTTPIPSTGTVATWNHNCGFTPKIQAVKVVCVSADIGYAVGDEISNPSFYVGGSNWNNMTAGVGRLTAVFAYNGTWVGQIYLNNKSTGAPTSIGTGANWGYKMDVERGW
jgi:hypothetical protein